MSPSQTEGLIALLDQVGLSFDSMQADHLRKVERAIQGAPLVRAKLYGEEATFKQLLLDLSIHVEGHRDAKGPTASLKGAAVAPALQQLGGKLGQEFLALDAEGAKVRQSLTAAQAEAGGWPLRVGKQEAKKGMELDSLKQQLAIFQCITGITWDADDGSGSVSGYASYPGGPEVMDFFAPAGKSEVETAQEIWETMEYADYGLP
eukprot:EG_transcript_26499